MAVTDGSQLTEPINSECPWSGKPVSDDALALYRGVTVGFCNRGCRDKFLDAIEMFDALIDGDLTA